MSAYLDASVLLPTLIAEPTTEAVYDCLAGDRNLLVSDFAAAEIASALSRLVRMARLNAADAAARSADFEAWRMAMIPISGQPMPGSHTFTPAASICGCGHGTHCISQSRGASTLPWPRSIGAS